MTRQCQVQNYLVSEVPVEGCAGPVVMNQLICSFFPYSFCPLAPCAKTGKAGERSPGSAFEVDKSSLAVGQDINCIYDRFVSEFSGCRGIFAIAAPCCLTAIEVGRPPTPEYPAILLRSPLSIRSREFILSAGKISALFCLPLSDKTRMFLSRAELSHRGAQGMVQRRQKGNETAD